MSSNLRRDKPGVAPPGEYRWKLPTGVDLPLETFFAPVTLTMDRWPSYTNLTRIPWRYTGCAKINFVHRDFQKLSPDIHTYIQTDIQTDALKTIYHAATRVVKNKWECKTQYIHTYYIHRRRSGWNSEGGAWWAPKVGRCRMRWGMGKGVPSPAD